MTITDAPFQAATDTPVSRPRSPVSETPPAASGTAEDGSRAPKRKKIKPGRGPADGRLTSSQKWVAGLIVGAALTLAGIGLYLSFEHVARFAYEELHFASLEKGQLFAVGVDTGIMVLIAVDLLMAWLKRPISWIRYPVWLLTAATVVLNAASGAPRGRAWGLVDYVAAFAHAVVPVLFIMIVELGRTSIDRVLRPSEKEERDSIPLDRWLLDPRATARMYRRMRLWGITSYPEMTRRDQELLAYEQWLKRKYRGNLKKATEDERLPMEMAKYGYTVAQALALPDEQEREAEQRAEEAERRRLDAETRREIARQKAEAQRLEAQGELDAARARVEGQTGQARAHARAQVSAAERAAELEEKALESALVAEARAREAEALRQEADERKARADAEAEAAELERLAAQKRKEAAEADKVAQAEAAAAESKAAAEAREAAAEADQRAAEIEKAAAKAREAAAEADANAAAEKAREEAAAAEAEQARLAAAEARAAAAEIEVRAIEMEDLARLSPRQRAVRKVARMIRRAGGDAHQVPLADIQNALGVVPATASEYRAEAAELLAAGVDPTQ